ncbi:hypothetical protein Tco_0304899 [Tanacetum coccineum]
MCTYLKNMAGFTHNQLKNKSFDEVQKAFDKTMSWIDSFVPMDSEVVKGSKDKAEDSKKRTRKGLDEESVKRQKLEDDTEKAELKLCLEIVLNYDEVVNFEPLAIKSPIVGWKTQILGEEMICYQIKSADGSCKMYKRFKTTRPEGSDRLLWGDLMTIFEPSEEDELWKNQQNYTLISWELYDSCGVHSLLTDTMYIHMLIHPTSIDSSKIDSLLDEFAGELTILKSIPPGIDDDNLDSEGEIHLVERLLYDNSSPRPPEVLNVENYIESFSPSPIPVEDIDSLMEEIDVFLALDGSISPGIESDDYDSEGDDNSTSLPEFESFHVDYPDLEDSTIDVVEDIPVDVPNILTTHPTLHMDFDFIPSHNDLGSDLDVSSPFGDRNKIYDPGICIEVESTNFLTTLSPVIDTLHPFSSENKDKVFNHGVLASKEKSLPSSSHRGFKASKLF